MQSDFLLNDKNLLSKLRWFAISAQFLCANLSFYFEAINRQQFILSMLCLIPIFLFNNYVSHYPLAQKYNLHQFLLDLLTTGALLFINGGLSNPFVVILFIHILLAPFFLNPSRSLVFIGFVFATPFILERSPYSFINTHLFISRYHLYLLAFFVTGSVVFCIAAVLIKEATKLNKNLLHLKNSSEKLDKYRSLGLLSAGVCHELGTPLSTIKMRIQRLEKKVSDNDDLECIERNIDKCIQSIGKLNTQVHDADSHFHLETIDLETVLRETLIPYGKEYGLHITITNKAQTATVTFPKFLLARTLIDLCDNSLEAHATTLKVQMDQEKREDQLYAAIDFIDNGEGFKKEVIDKIGTPFITSKASGVGLGLYHMVNTVTYLGGQLNIVPIEVGAHIKMTIPMELL